MSSALASAARTGAGGAAIAVRNFWRNPALARNPTPNWLSKLSTEDQRVNPSGTRMTRGYPMRLVSDALSGLNRRPAATHDDAWKHRKGNVERLEFVAA